MRFCVGGVSGGREGGASPNCLVFVVFCGGCGGGPPMKALLAWYKMFLRSRMRYSSLKRFSRSTAAAGSMPWTMGPAVE
jgi:hypothetical protein